MNMKHVVSSAAIATMMTAGAASAADVEVLHWWTSGGEAAALNVLKQDLEGQGIGWLDMPVVPLLLALVLGRQLEEQLRISLTSSKGDISIFFTSPISLTFLILSAISIAWSLYSARRASAPATSKESTA